MKGLITIQSDYSVKETIDRIASTVQAKGLTLVSNAVTKKINAHE